MVLDLYGAVLAGIYDTGTVKGTIGCYLVVQGQYRAVQVGTWWYWVIVAR